MGMFDYVSYECACPVCKTKISEFQTKDYDCELVTLEPREVNYFYANCGKCGGWIEFSRVVNSTELFIRVVKGRVNGIRGVLKEHTRKVSIRS